MTKISLADLLSKGKEEEVTKKEGDIKIKIIDENQLYNTSGKIRDVLNYYLSGYPVRAAWTMDMKNKENTCEMYLRGYINPSDAGVDDKFTSISQIMLLGRTLLTHMDNGTIAAKDVLSMLDAEQYKTLENEVIVRQKYSMLAEPENADVKEEMMAYSLFEQPFKVDKALAKGNMLTVATVKHEAMRNLIVNELWDETIEIIDNKNINDKSGYKYVITEPNIYLESKIDEILPRDREYIRGATKSIESDELGSKPSILSKIGGLQK